MSAKNEEKKNQKKVYSEKNLDYKQKSLWLFVIVGVLVVTVILIFFLFRTKRELDELKRRFKEAKTISNKVSTILPDNSSFHTKSVVHENYSSLVLKNSSVNNSVHSGNEPYYNIRLPSSIKPYFYNIYLDVNLTTDIVLGSCDIHVEVYTPTKYVIVHAFHFEKINADILFEGNTIASKSQFFYPENQYYVVKLDKLLDTGKYILKYRFLYKLKNDLQGFYKASYRNNAGKERFLASTQFAPVEARTAFPCFDEPSMKAQFKLTLNHDSQLISVSNMPIESSETKNGKTKNTFKTSSIMSTYLVAFVVCDFKMKSAYTGISGNIKMEFYAPETQIDQLDFALKVGEEILPFFEAYYNVSYPLPKVDMVAVPDFAAGAMENWGLITYRLEYMLFNPNESAILNKKYIATTVSHELAHMWFGNIVTMDWWSDLWLNEGFATFVSYLGIEKIFPSWNIADDQVVSDGAVALKLDALESSHPIHVDVTHPNEISEIFDVISYKKGSYILRMLDGFLGNDVFLKGLHNYLHMYSFGNAKTQHLWNVLTEAAGGKYNVSKIMDTWTLQMGFPVVTVSSISDKSFELTQSRFYSYNSTQHSTFSSKFNYKWMIPFHYTTYKKLSSGWTQVGSINMTWMEMTDKTLSVSQGLMIKGNSHQKGFYRVNYDRMGWEKIIEILKENHTVFDVKDRAGLISDVFAFADSGCLNYWTALDLIDYIDKDNDYLPWAALDEATLTLRKLLSFNEQISKRFKDFLLKKTSPLFEKYGFRKEENFNKRNLQVLIVSLACESGHPACLKNASMLFNMWMNQPNQNPISPDFRDTVYYYGVQNGYEKEWNFLYDRYLHTNTPSETSKLLHGMAGSKQLWLIDRYLLKSLNNTIVKDQDFGYVINYVANSNAVGQYLSFSFIKEHWSFLYNRHMRSHFTLKEVFEGIFSGFSTEHELQKFQAFVSSIENLGSLKRVMEQLLEKIRANIEWRKYNEILIYEWLLRKNY
ncbi:glutamyl aminopeptidase isoform X1 [Hydra vulgaris]|uniref:glutamyl aminopeptidase isoform X1 n=2 Tax=Hydra vulgaris TaxID=6087 RepID=UPI001F5EBD03|nr:glutamyl aminopeptidase [Hydra vulgaris]